MKRPKTHMPKRPRISANAPAKNAKEAAINLVRLEFDAARLEMGIAQAEDRAASYTAELAQNQAQKDRLMAVLTDAQQNRVHRCR